MTGIKITYENGNIKFLACYYYKRKGSQIIALCENNEVKVLNHIQEVKEI